MLLKYTHISIFFLSLEDGDMLPTPGFHKVFLLKLKKKYVRQNLKFWAYSVEIRKMPGWNVSKKI